MTPAEVLADALDRSRQNVAAVLDGLTETDLAHRPADTGNPIGWLVWHLARVVDDHVAGVSGGAQAYPAFADRFGLPYDVTEIGYGQSGDDVAAFARAGVGAAVLREYAEAAFEAASAFVGGLTDADLDRVVDADWDPPVTLGVRLVSVADDAAQHVGQAAYVRGLLAVDTR